MAPRKITAAEAARLGAVPVESDEEAPRKITAAEAARLGAVEAPEATIARNRADRAPFEGIPAEPARTEPGGLEAKSISGAALRGLGKGGSLGFSDEIGGAMGAADELGRRQRAFLGIQTDSDPVEDSKLSLKDALVARYRRERDASRQEQEASGRAHPGLVLGTEIAGALAVPLPGPGKLKPFATVGGRALRYGASGATQGALSGAGNSTSDLTAGDVGGALRDTGGGALMGGAASGVLGPAAELTQARVIAPWAAKKARERAVSAIAPNAGLANQLRKKLGVASEEEIQSLGGDILDTGVLRPGGTAGGALRRTEDMMTLEGDRIGGVLREADELAARGVATPFQPQDARLSVRKALRESADVPALQTELPAVREKLLERVGVDPGVGQAVEGVRASPSFADAWKNKSILQRALKPDEFSKPAEKLYRSGVGGYTKSIYDQVESQVGPDLAAELREAAKKYGTGAKIEDFLRELNSRNQQRGAIGLMDTQVGQVAGDALRNISPYAGAAVTGLSALTRGRMDSTVATGLNAVSKVRGPQAGAAVSRAVRAALATPKDQQDEDAVAAWINGT